MNPHPLAGKTAPRERLANIPRLMTAYYTGKPDASNPFQKVAFGTSGHRGISTRASFNEDHILAVSLAVCEHRKAQNIDGPLFLGMDTHALSEAAHVTAVEVFAAAGVTLMVAKDLAYTPTPAVSHAILTHNRGRTSKLADGVIITPSHNPPEHGGFKYNPPTGGPAGTRITGQIAKRANEILLQGTRRVPRMDFNKAMKAETTILHDYITPYVADLKNVVDMAAIARAGLRLGADPLGGASVGYWEPIAQHYNLSVTVVNPAVDPAFSFMPLDKDGKIRMDCSSSFAMAGLIHMKDRFDIAFGNDPDADRHGIVTPGAGLLNPNHFLAVAVWYLFQNRPGWKPDTAVGKTAVSTSVIDRVAARLARRLTEVPVGFKWFVDGLLSGELGFGGEESAGASFLRKDGTVWCTDKDGLIMDLLAAEILAVTGKDPGIIYRELEAELGASVYERQDAPATREQKAVLTGMTPDLVTDKDLAGEPILGVFTRAPGNDQALGGLKVVAENGWFAARPSGTEDIYKIYAESFKGGDHLRAVQDQAREMVGRAFEKGLG